MNIYNYFYNNLVDLNNAINSRWPQSEDRGSIGYKPMHLKPCLPQDIWNEILQKSKTDLVALACASQSLNKLVQNYAKNYPDCFGAKEWKNFGADQMVALPVPLKMIQDFDSSNWMLTWIPETINGKELTLSRIDQFVSDFKNGKDAFKSNYVYPPSDFGVTDQMVTPFKAHWVMLSKDVLDETRSENFATQEKQVRERGFEIPNLIDVVASIFLYNLKTGEFIYPDNSNGHEWTYTRVQEQTTSGVISVGGFSALGLNVYASRFAVDCDFFGASCSVKSIGT